MADTQLEHYSKFDPQRFGEESQTDRFFTAKCSKCDVVAHHECHEDELPLAQRDKHVCIRSGCATRLPNGTLSKTAVYTGQVTREDAFNARNWPYTTYDEWLTLRDAIRDWRQEYLTTKTQPQWFPAERLYAYRKTKDLKPVIYHERDRQS